MTFTDLAPALSDPPEPFTDQLRRAVTAYLARFRGTSREHTGRRDEGRADSVATVPLHRVD